MMHPMITHDGSRVTMKGMTHHPPCNVGERIIMSNGVTQALMASAVVVSLVTKSSSWTTHVTSLLLMRCFTSSDIIRALHSQQ